MSHTTAVIIRYALAALFLWFGVQQLIDPAIWVGFLPEWTGYAPIPGEMLVQLNGWSEIILGIMLALGVLTRFVAALLGAHLMLIAVTAGGAIGMRDGALALTTLALVFSKPDAWTLDSCTAHTHTEHSEPEQA